MKRPETAGRHQLLSDLIFEAMTIDMTSILEDGEHMPRSSVLVRLRAGDQGPPLFFFPGATGDLSELALLAARMRGPAPIFGVKLRGAHSSEIPHERIEDMAEYALNEIKLAAQDGPYLLAGYSWGGSSLLKLRVGFHLVGRVFLCLCYWTPIRAS